MRLGDLDALKTTLKEKFDDFIPEGVYDEIDNTPTAEPEKVLVANVTFDEDELKDIVQTEVIEKIKSGELVIKDKKPKGEWIKVQEIMFSRHACSLCNHYPLVDEDTGETVLSNFCPNCGADMRGDKNDNDK